jgi:hypothetical protein
MLPQWELSLYLLASLGFHFYSFYEVYKVSRGKASSFSDCLSKKEVGKECPVVEDSGRWSLGVRMNWALPCFPIDLDS